MDGIVVESSAGTFRGRRINLADKPKALAMGLQYCNSNALVNTNNVE
jgi:hypothetical protein